MRTAFAVLGDGAWGTAIALLLAQNQGHRVTLWSAREDNGRLLQEHRENVRLLPGVSIPASVDLTTDVRRAVDGAGLWVSAIPTVYLRHTLERVRDAVPSGPPILSLTKGLEVHTFRRPTEILSEMLGVGRVAVLSGPSHAEEVSRGLPTSVVVASHDLELARWVQAEFSTDRFRVYTNLDPVGVELAGALKNVIGIAAGISDGLGFGDNAKSALLTRGLAEITRFAVALGARCRDVRRPGGDGRPHHDLREPSRPQPARRRTAGSGRKSCRRPGRDVHGGRGRLHGPERPRTGDANGHRHADHDRSVSRPVRGQGSAPGAVNDLMLRSPKGEEEP